MLNQRDERRYRPSRDRVGAYGLVLLSILLTIIVAAAVGRSQWGRWFVAALQGATLLLTLSISGAKLRERLATFVFVVLGLVVAAISVMLGASKTSYAIAAGISGLLVVGAPVAIVRGVRGQLEVTFSSGFSLLSRTVSWRRSIQGRSLLRASMACCRTTSISVSRLSPQ
jgi:hypothetical protein